MKPEKKISHQINLPYGTLTLDFWSGDLTTGASAAANSPGHQIDFFRQEYGKSFRFLNQVHGDSILQLSGQSQSIDQDCWGDFDGIFTQEKNLPLAIRVADCLPLLIWSNQAPFIMVLHCGWRGIFKKIIPNGLKNAREKLKSAAGGQFQYWIGPHIQADTYEVGAEFEQYFSPSFFLPHPVSSKRFLSLRSLVMTQLAFEKIGENDLLFTEDSHLPTLVKEKKLQQFSSHRMGNSGRNVLVARLT